MSGSDIEVTVTASPDLTPIERARQARRALDPNSPTYADDIARINDETMRATGVRAMQPNQRVWWQDEGASLAADGSPTTRRRGSVAGNMRIYPREDGTCPDGYSLVAGMCSRDTTTGPNGVETPTIRGTPPQAGMIGDWVSQYFLRIVFIVLGLVLLGAAVLLLGRKI